MNPNVIQIILKKYFCLIIIAMLYGCDKQNQDFETIQNVFTISDNFMRSIENKKILFCHMSVGYDIVKGLKDIIQ
jgi:hypothetical protein